MAKRDALRELEREVQAAWATEHAFECDAPVSGACDKLMVTFPYPYMNGRLHLGHAFTLSKAEFAAAYGRLCGKKVLFPFGFHCTGMPIKASADKLANEMATYGVPPVLPEDAADDAPTKAKHSKVAAKTGGAKLQWDIMAQLGIPAEEIPAFADPLYWTQYFPPLAQADLSALGCHVDWRRSFITTDANPFYDTFVRWMFNKLRAQGRVKYGKRHCIFSPHDGQPCLDHDRSSGEGVNPKEFTVVLLRLLPSATPSETLNALQSLIGSGAEVFLAAATLRPETMYGQTNVWLGPDVEYGVYELAHLAGDGPLRAVVCTRRAALNMAYQGILAATTAAEVSSLCGTLKGTDMFGMMAEAPLAAKAVPVLPMFAVSATIGTGVVTSVPSNSPADFVALTELQAKEALRRKFGLSDAAVLAIAPVPIMRTPKYGEMTAPAIVAELGIKSQNDAAGLEAAKELAYREDFYAGIMAVGAHAGRPVSEAKAVLRDELVAAGDAFVYWEPEGPVVSRSGDACVVALVDQWYIDYGEPSWRADTERALAGMECYCDEVRRQFEATLGWLRQWACSRSFGLGSRLPWDPQYLVESLSDSTVYMAYYTVAHILHEGSFDGSTRPCNIAPADMTDDVWEWIFAADDALAMPATSIPAALMARMRSEFRFWYPMDMRVSGKDLVPNHLTFSLYAHVALFAPRFWPRGMRANGHLLLNSAKMSKSTGNFMTIRDALDEFGADATRFALADAGDGVEDANFLRETANAAILRLHAQLEFFSTVLASDAVCSGDAADVPASAKFADDVFANEMNRAIVAATDAYGRTAFREALKAGFFELQNARDRYRDATVVHGTGGMCPALVRRFMRVQLALLYPVAPHFCEALWRRSVRSPEEPMSLVQAGIPDVTGPVDDALLSRAAFLSSVAHGLRTTLQAEQRAAAKRADTSEMTAAELYVATAYPRWQEDVISVLRSLYDTTARAFPADDAVVRALQPVMRAQGRVNKKLIPFAMELKARVAAEGISVLSRDPAFDEAALLRDNIDYITRALGLTRIDVVPIDPSAVESDASSGADKEVLKRKEACLPGSPSIFFKRG